MPLRKIEAYVRRDRLSFILIVLNRLWAFWEPGPRLPGIRQRRFEQDTCADSGISVGTLPSRQN